MKDRSSVPGIVPVILSACLFALGGILIKLCTLPAASINGSRCVFSGLVLALYMKAKGHRFTFSKGTLICALSNFLTSLLFVMANKMTTAANAIVLQFTMPAFVIVLQRLVWKRKVGKAAVIACAASFAGILCFFFESLGGGRLTGDLVAVLSGLLYAILFLSKQITGTDFESGVLLSFVFGFLAGLPSLPAAIPLLSLRNVLIVVVLGVVQQALPYILLDKGLDRVPPVTASLVSMVEPILNPLLVAVFYHETVGPVSLVGAAIVLGSSLWYNLKGKQAA